MICRKQLTYEGVTQPMKHCSLQARVTCRKPKKAKQTQSNYSSLCHTIYEQPEQVQLQRQIAESPLHCAITIIHLSRFFHEGIIAACRKARYKIYI